MILAVEDALVEHHMSVAKGLRDAPIVALPQHRAPSTLALYHLFGHRPGVVWPDDGYVGLVFPRSSLSSLDIALSNCVGVIDSGYRGEVTAKFKPAMLFNREQRPIILNNRIYEVGERVAQIIIIPYPKIEFIESDELSETERGTGGYGSSGK